MIKFSKIKITAFILILIMIIASVFILGCGEKSAENSEGKTPDKIDGFDSENIQNETPKEKEEPVNSVGARPDYDLPEQNYNGCNFKIISRSETANVHWWNCDISVEEENGDAINDAVYSRNKKVEERYNINIINIPDNDVGTKAAKSIKAGSDDYDLIVIGLTGGQENLSVAGYLTDLHKVPYVDLTNPWWDQKAVEQLSINNKLFATSCDMTIRDKDAVILFTFSKKLIKDYELENPYELVLSGRWTLDKMLDMMKKVSYDLNGDGKMDDKDRYGLLTEYVNSEYLLNAAGEYISRLNQDKIPEITLYSERTSAVLDKIIEIYKDRNYSVNAEDMTGKYADVWDGFQLSVFSENRALFYHAGMNRVTLLRTMETDFGILPPPKYDENQNNYYAAVDAWCTSAVSVPITATDKEKNGLILETLAYESRYILLPAYYDINLKTKFARDEESREMIDIILANRLYDLGAMYAWGNTYAFFADVSKGKGDSLAAYWEKNGGKIESAMQKTLIKLDDLD